MKTVHLVLSHTAAKLLYYDQETRAMRPELVFVTPDGTTHFEINEVGLKGDPIDAARKLAVVWGDSVVFSAGRGWPCLLDGLAAGFQFLNGGVEGDPYSNVLRRAREFNQRTAVHLNLLMLGWHPIPDNQNVRSALISFVRNTPNTVLLTMPTALNRQISDQDLSSYITRPLRISPRRVPAMRICKPPSTRCRSMVTLASPGTMTRISGSSGQKAPRCCWVMPTITAH